MFINLHLYKTRSKDEFRIDMDSKEARQLGKELLYMAEESEDHGLMTTHIPPVDLTTKKRISAISVVPFKDEEIN